MALNSRLASHLRSGQVSRVIYGSIIGLALVLTMEAHPPTSGVAVGTLLSTAVAVALAELYSEAIGARARSSLGSSTHPLGTMMTDAVAVAFGIAFPSVFFLAVVLDLMDYDTAFAVAKWTGLGLIAGYGYVAARLSGTRTARALVEAVVVALIAAVLIGLKALVH
jgi:VIT1/CCC1 family predicted Fe2+/Mn2+ transporter